MSEQTATADTQAIVNTDDCVGALDRALSAIYPEFNVYEAVLRIIADFVPFGALNPSMFEEAPSAQFRNVRHRQRTLALHNLDRRSHGRQRQPRLLKWPLRVCDTELRRR